MILEWLFTFLVFYLLYKLIFGLILPVSRASSQIRSKMNEMHQQQQPPRQQTADFSKSNSNASAKPAKDDYIDFEEIK